MSLTTPDVCYSGPLPSLPDEADARDLAEKFKALGDPVRLRLMTMVTAHPEGEVCVCEMTSHFDLTPATISYHLKVLRKAGLIIGDRRGTWVYYRPTPDALRRLSHVLGHPDGMALSTP